jgi:hypothetical protein
MALAVAGDGGIQSLRSQKTWIGYGINASDHWPVFVEFGL